MASKNIRTIAVINGPNLHWLGRREPEIYGSTTLAGLERALIEDGQARGWAVECYQSNSEGALLDCIYALKERDVTDLIVNAGAYTHTSVDRKSTRLISSHVATSYA